MTQSNHHKRRYSKRALKHLIERSPLKLGKIGYFNSLLFPLAVAERVGLEAERKRRCVDGPSVAAGERALERTFAAERHLIGKSSACRQACHSLRSPNRVNRLVTSQ